MSMQQYKKSEKLIEIDTLLRPTANTTNITASTTKMPQQSVFSPFSELKETEVKDSPWLVPPPSRPFHVVVAPGWAREQPRPPGPPELHYPLQPFRQTPGPITTSQTYLRTLVLQRWDAEIRHCDDACKVQLSERIQGPVTHQTFVRELIVGRWSAEKQQCQEAQKVQLLELLLAAHGVTTLV
ncbi:hypothetical protein F4604DRAFT_1936254 [Suillus subluteus]|nr:hypothetical protein F4604DRAFT_1936254 [Suillus subluteus]